ncbi:MAG: helix-turn-helix domain-containing protein [Acetobacteraceae bacterium]
MSELVCRLGPDDRPFEEQHQEVGIALVLAGSFRYRSETGSALLYPGAFLLGNAGTCFTCGHEHATGDHCLAFHFDPEFFSEIAAAVTGTHRFRFSAPMLPAGGAPAPVLAGAEVAAAGAEIAEEEVITIAETVLGALSNQAPQVREPSPRDQKRIGDALCHLEQNFDRPLGLAELAAIARMSRYHFLRTFRSVLGTTPYRLVQHMRMRRAARALAGTAEPVASIAFASGFGDLSTFNARFRALFGRSPTLFRAQSPRAQRPRAQRPRRSSVRASTTASS